MESLNHQLKLLEHGMAKKHETLVSKEEIIIAKEYKSYFQIPNDERDLNYNNYFSKGNIKKII